MKARKQKLTLRDIGRLPLHVSPDVAKPETLVQFAQRLEREEKEKAERPFIEAQAKISSDFERLNAPSVAFWSQNLDSLKTAGHSAPFAVVSGFALNFPQLPSEPEVIKIAESEAQNAFAQFVAKLPAKGYQLTEDGICRFACLCMAHQLNGIWLTPAVIVALWDWAIAYEIFAPEEISIDHNIVNPTEPERPKTFDEILATTPMTTAEGERLVKAALHKHVVRDGEFAEQFQKFFAFMQDMYGVTLQEYQLAAFWDGFRTYNLSPLNPKHWDFLKLNLRAKGILPSHCWSLREKLDSDFRNAVIDDRTYLSKVRSAELDGTIDKPVQVAFAV
jgi:hypothetical protein